eukprot:3083711-Rhodomonas_salina.4
MEREHGKKGEKQEKEKKFRLTGRSGEQRGRGTRRQRRCFAPPAQHASCLSIERHIANAVKHDDNVG